ncbi:hypothetical protein O6H91_01G004100 [Diphasiastrum complanatum]|uniref:Uncharacterized protein n=2 Tax=Diphasiastrum complanatum TaxID=34168 RepID=A0ACC2EMS0_DIPCM|nr:hypothetical protein O6H91_02G129600 [Diphasiastrum complanatum]KAJ7567725.1 hypothetical protein O6H91_01G004100 [Diphasiastrum complanatum]
MIVHLLLMSQARHHLPPAPPPLLHLTIDAAVQHIQHVHSLASIPDILVQQLFLKTLAAGKLTEPVLQVFLATGHKEVFEIVKALKIRPILKPVLPTRCSDKF